MTFYRLPKLHEYEVLPPCDTIPLYFLNYPGLLLSLYHYIFVILMVSNKVVSRQVDYETTYFLSQYLFHGVYALCIFQNWKVVNLRLYKAQMKTVWPFLALAIHGYLFFFFQDFPYVFGPILSFYMGIYWKYHMFLLNTTNQTLLDAEIE
jgi:hypothetical protein